ncbi:aminomethyltransferase family protein [Desulfatitalea alkaliphila]|uniref:Aminomethyltransferase family protein n=1 Tax=Desulfatitalea alkaliphila TaxID=2929485 RepID=A0AA41R7G1_9BACT|nr:aminomethyltransferase family protein [Desulfatitalea alkaliphila]MCJ8503031.1 aminomethyltransferase family protein [Desulfatitalea alkaliphila]
MTHLASIHRYRKAVMSERNGITLPASFNNEASAHGALRESILLADYSHFGLLEVSGEDRFDFLDRVVAGDLAYIREEQALYSLILDNEGYIITDIYVLCDDERYLLLSEWFTGKGLADLLGHYMKSGESVILKTRNRENGVLLVEGPYSWELMAEIFGIDVIGLPYMEFMPVEGGLLFRGGKHGEFSYKLIMEVAVLADVWKQLQEHGERYDIEVSGLDFQIAARLENPCWNPMILGKVTRCPIELQMQWAVRYDKDEFVGRDALKRRLEEGVKRRVVGFCCEESIVDVRVGSRVFHGDRIIGEVAVVGYSAFRQAVIGQAIIDNSYAYAGLGGYTIESEDEKVAISTVPVPFIGNFSFLVNPSEHSYVDPSRPKSFLDQVERQPAGEEAEI